MKNLILFILVFCLGKMSVSQSTDSVDNIVLKIPATWKIDKQATFTQLTLFDNSIKSFCQLVIYNQQPSSADKQKDFEKEWKELIEKNFTVLTIVNPTKMKDKQGYNLYRHGANGIGTDGNKYFIQLNMYDCGSYIQSVIAVSGSKEYLSKYDSLWQPMIANVKNQSTISTVNKTAEPKVDVKLVGVWHKVSSSPPAYTNGVLTNAAYAGYAKGEYNFKSDGSYTYHGERSGNSTEYRLVDEKGSFTVSGSQLIVSPSSSLQRVIDGSGNIKKTENLSLSRRTYSWQTHYFEGLQETALIFTGIKENAVDGGFSSSPLFLNSFIYSPGKKLEFRFQSLYN